jgi:hypothetical protein
VSDYDFPKAMRYLPQVAAATALVAVVPVLAVWWLNGEGVVSSPLLCVLLTVALALAASLAGSEYWKRRHGNEDLLFSELLVWGWVRHVRNERKLANATKLLGLEYAEEHAEQGAVSAEESERLVAELAASLEALDAYTVGHSRRVANHSELIARTMGLSDEEVKRIRAAAVVHDVGKLRVPRAVLNKPGRLTDEEFEVTKRHAADGAEMVAVLDDAHLTAIVRHHHERIDGSGYPAGLAAEEIPIGARIVAVADTFDAIISTRPYRPAAPHKRALDVLSEESGTHFDPHVVEAFQSRYAGKRAVSIWATVALLPPRAVAWTRSLRGVGRPTSPRQRADSATALAAMALLAALVPFAASAHTQPQPLIRARWVATPVSLVKASASHRPAHAAASTTPAQHSSGGAAPSSTCQAYNPQLCTVLAGHATSNGNPSAGGVGGTSGLPFTG